MMESVLEALRRGAAYSAYAAAAVGATGLFCLVNCFFGSRLFKFWMAFCGFLPGFGLGAAAASLLSDDQRIALGAGVLVGLIGGLIAYQVYLVGAFLIGWVFVFLAFYPTIRELDLPDKEKLLCLLASVLLGLAVAVLAVRFSRPVILLTTAVGGGLGAGNCILQLLGQSDARVAWILGILLAILGALAQSGRLKTGKKRRR